MIKLESARRILVVDDDPALAAVLKYHLERYNYFVTVCQDGLDAWNVLNNSNNQFDLMITDHQMPKINGLELCEMIRWEHLRPELTIFLVTEKSLELDLQSIQSHLGINQIISRPFSPSDLISRVDDAIGSEILERKRAQKSHFGDLQIREDRLLS